MSWFKKKALLCAAALLIGCSKQIPANVKQCFPKLSNTKVSGLIIHISVDHHGETTSLVSEICNREIFKVKFAPDDHSALSTLNSSSKAIYQVEGRIAEIDFERQSLVFENGAKLRRASEQNVQHVIDGMIEGTWPK